MRKLLVVAILGLFGFSAQAGKLRSVPAYPYYINGDSGDLVKNTDINANVDSDFVLNLGLNGLGNIEKESEKSASHSCDYSAEKHHDSQKIDISINFNVGGGDSSEDSEYEVEDLSLTKTIVKEIEISKSFGVGY